MFPWKRLLLPGGDGRGLWRYLSPRGVWSAGIVTVYLAGRPVMRKVRVHLS